jgi:hypothetical protein
VIIPAIEDMKKARQNGSADLLSPVLTVYAPQDMFRTV